MVNVSSVDKPKFWNSEVGICTLWFLSPLFARFLSCNRISVLALAKLFACFCLGRLTIPLTTHLIVVDCLGLQTWWLPLTARPCVVPKGRSSLSYMSCIASPPIVWWFSLGNTRNVFPLDR